MNQDEFIARDSGREDGVYNLSLLMAFMANVFQLISVSLLFRYADFVYVLGGTEFNLGLVVGIATAGAILFRVVQGMAIDRLGPQLIWITSLLAQVVALLVHRELDSATTLPVYLTRGLYAMGIAGSFGSWLSFTSLQAPAHRVAEVIGVVGASGFVGMATGPLIGDYIFNEQVITRSQINLMFSIAATMAFMACVFAQLACWSGKSVTGSTAETIKLRRKNPITLIRNSRPGLILAVGALMGLVMGFPGTYLRPFAASLSIREIGTFFLVYNATAFVVRMIFRRTPERIGLKNAIAIGFGFFFLSLLLYMTVRTKSGFWLPAVIGGFGHAFLFPSVIAACTNQFEKEDRGVATQLILAMYDLGVFVGMPVIGFLLSRASGIGVPPYPMAIGFLCLMILSVGWLYYREPVASES